MRTATPSQTTTAFLLLACVVLMFSARLFGPSALQRYDQPRTASYTADIALNGRWLLPRDMHGDIATKPPLVNLLAAPLLQLGVWTVLIAFLTGAWILGTRIVCDEAEPPLRIVVRFW